MPLYRFKAKKISGEELEDEREARNPQELARTLRDSGFILIAYSESEEKSGSPWFSFPAIFGVSTAEKMNFAKNLSVMIGAGMPLVKGLETLGNQAVSKTFKKTILALAGDIKKGTNLSEAMGGHPNIFSDLFRAMVKAGEISGKLEDSLNLIASQLKQDYELKKKIKGALIYPAIIFVAMLGIGVLMLIYVVPTLVATFQELNIQLPATTRFIIALSSFLTGQGIAAFLIFVLFVGSAWFYIFKTISGRKITAAFLMRLPVISGLVRETNAARTSRTLASLLNAGVKVTEALEITENVIQNHYYKNVLKEAREEIQKGKLISGVFVKHNDIYPPVMAEMMMVGEETGKLSEMLFQLADFYENEVASKTKDLSTIVEPVMMLFIGTAVGFFAISMFQPMYSMIGSF